MFLNSLYIIAAILGFICIYIIGFKYKLNRMTNIYLILLFTLNSIKFLLFFIQNLSFLENIQLLFAAFTNIFVAPFFYLYFYSLVRNRKQLALYDLKHFIIPIILFSLYSSKYLIDVSIYSKIIKYVFLITILLVLIYIVKSYALLSKHAWNRKSDIKLIDNQNRSVSKWSLYFFIFIIISSSRIFFNLFYHSNVPWTSSYNNYYWLTAILCSALYIKIIIAPEFLSGYDILQNKIKHYKKHNVILNDVWKLENPKLLQNNQDLMLKGK
jgi:hypothetical protein